MDVQQLADELAIRKLVHSYSDAIVRRDTEAWGGTWAEECEWKIFGKSVHGREDIVATWQKFMGGLPFVHQQASGGLIDFADGGPTGRWYVTEYGVSEDDGPGTSILGVYHDDYINEAGTWRFSRRIFNALYMGPPDLSAQARPFPENL